MNNKSNNSNLSVIISGIIVFFLVTGAIVYAFNNSQPKQEVKNEIGFNTSNSSFSANPNIINEMTGGSANTSLASSDAMMMIKPNETSPAATPSKVGKFLSYNSSELSQAKDGHKVVIFFNASWCPSCQSTVKDINANKDKIDSKLHILSADYDKETELRKKYGVTMQHTFVEVNSNGDLIQKKTGLDTLEEITKFALS